MANAESIQTAHDIATPVTHNITANDTSPWMVVQHVPILGTNGTSAKCQVFASTLTFTVDGAVPAGKDVVGISGKFNLTLAAYDTMGELVDAINGARAWRAYLVGAIRADTPSFLLIQANADCRGDNGLTVYSDSSNSDEWSFAISGEKFVNNGVAGHVKDWDSQCENSVNWMGLLYSGASSGHSLKYYTGRAGDTETQLGSSQATVISTLFEQGEDNPSIPWISATRGHRLVCRVANNSATSKLGTTLAWNTVAETAVLDGSRLVSEDNY